MLYSDWRHWGQSVDGGSKHGQLGPTTEDPPLGHPLLCDGSLRTGSERQKHVLLVLSYAGKSSQNCWEDQTVSHKKDTEKWYFFEELHFKPWECVSAQLSLAAPVTMATAVKGLKGRVLTGNDLAVTSWVQGGGQSRHVVCVCVCEFECQTVRWKNPWLTR